MILKKTCESEKNNSTIATFVYDGDGRRVKSVLTTNVGSTTTYFVGAHYEVTNGIVTKYYYAGSQRVAMRKNNVVSYLISDHLGSTSLVTNSSGALVSQTLYKAWGEERYSSGVQQTNYTYTGQYSYTGDFGLMFYQSRFYDPQLGRFSSPDSIIPEQTQGVQAWDRYAYVNNSPLMYTDPTGHYCAGNIVQYVVCAVVIIVVFIGTSVKSGVEYQRDTIIITEQPEGYSPQNRNYPSPSPTVTRDPNYKLPTPDFNPLDDPVYPTPTAGMNYPSTPDTSYIGPTSTATTTSTPTPCIQAAIFCPPPPANCGQGGLYDCPPPLSSTTPTYISPTNVSSSGATNTPINTPLIPTSTNYPTNTPRHRSALIPY